MKLIYIVTASETLNFFSGQFSYLKNSCGFEEIYAISSPSAKLYEISLKENIRIHPIEMERRITPLKDFLTIYKLFLFFRSIKPTIVHAHTPKASLLGLIAATLAGVPIRIYHLHGLVFSTSLGIKRKILKFTEMITCKLSHRVFSVSQSIRDTIIRNGLCPKRKITVIGPGSVNGIDARSRFNPEKMPLSMRIEIRNKYNIPLDSPVIGFVGRIVKDKGIIELAISWEKLRATFPNLHLVLIGPIENFYDPVPEPILEKLSHDERVHLIGPVDNPEIYYPAMDIFVLPTLREGFPVTPLEAAAMGVPVVTTQVDGCVEAVIGGATGILVPPKDAGQLARVIQLLIQNPELRKQMGKAGRERVLEQFRPELIWHSLYKNYMELIQNINKNNFPVK